MVILQNGFCFERRAVVALVWLHIAPNAKTLFGCVRMANSTTDSGGFLIFGGGSISASQPATGRMMCGVQSRFTVTSPRISHLRM